MAGAIVLTFGARSVVLELPWEVSPVSGVSQPMLYRRVEIVRQLRGVLAREADLVDAHGLRENLDSLTRDHGRVAMDYERELTDGDREAWQSRLLDWNELEEEARQRRQKAHKSPCRSR